MRGESPNSLRAIIAGLGNISSPPVIIIAGLDFCAATRRVTAMHGESPNSLCAIVAGLGTSSVPPIVIVACLPPGCYVIGPLAPLDNEGHSGLFVGAPPRCRFVQGSLRRERDGSVFNLFCSTSHFPICCYQLCELKTKNKLRDRWPSISWPPTHLPSLLSGFSRLLGLAQS